MISLNFGQMNLMFAWKKNWWGLVFDWLLRKHGQISRCSLMRNIARCRLFGDNFMILIQESYDDD